MPRSESNIAYLAIDMVHIHNPALYAMSCINDLMRRKPKAWFIDIVHTASQIPRALQLQELLTKELEARYPWQVYGGDVITIRLNIAYSHELKAKQQMESIINSHRKVGQARNVVYKDPDGKELPIEY